MKIWTEWFMNNTFHSSNSNRWLNKWKSSYIFHRETRMVIMCNRYFLVVFVDQILPGEYIFRGRSFVHSILYKKITWRRGKWLQMKIHLANRNSLWKEVNYISNKILGGKDISNFTYSQVYFHLCQETLLQLYRILRYVPAMSYH